MVVTTAIAYGIMLLLTPVPNIAIYSYYKEKPILTKVLLFIRCLLPYNNENIINGIYYFFKYYCDSLCKYFR